MVGIVLGVLQGYGGGRHVPSFVRYGELTFYTACEWGIDQYWSQLNTDDDLVLVQWKELTVFRHGLVLREAEPSIMTVLCRIEGLFT